jgi:hypothetical protein
VEEGGDQQQCEAPKATAGAFVLAGRHFDSAELWDLSRVSRGALLVDLGVAQGEVAMGLSAVSWGMFFVGSVLVGKRGVAYLKRRFCR